MRNLCDSRGSVSISANNLVSVSVTNLEDIGNATINPLYLIGLINCLISSPGATISYANVHTLAAIDID
jgi:hypothetical protein